MASIYFARECERDMVYVYCRIQYISGTNNRHAAAITYFYLQFDRFFDVVIRYLC